MNEQLIEQGVSCPYCGEYIEILVDTSIGQQSYIEDCQVCCRPIVLDIAIGELDEVTVTARDENDA